MMIGLDLDNTIVNYDTLFYDLAVDRELIPATVAANKTAVREHLREEGREEDWTRLQGVVYGAEMHRAAPFPGFLEFVPLAREQNCRLNVISHRTRHPHLGPAIDLHQAAASWLNASGAGFAASEIYFEISRELKMQRIQAQACDVFVDDLPEFLSDPAFPSGVRRIWFNPNRLSGELPFESVASWRELGACLELDCQS